MTRGVLFLLLLPAAGLAPLVFPFFQSSQLQLERSASLKFSHRRHLNQWGARCVDCHRGAAQSAAVSDNNLPREEDCLSCHDGERARKECSVCHTDPQAAHPLEPVLRSLRFSHQQHLELGNFAPIIAGAIEAGTYLSKVGNLAEKLETEDACAACHRGLEETDFSHAGNLPHMADCLVCHAEINPPYSCELCHTPGARLKPDTHTADYLDLHSSKDYRYERGSCTICHGTNFRCLGCH